MRRGRPAPAHNRRVLRRLWVCGPATGLRSRPGAPQAFSDMPQANPASSDENFWRGRLLRAVLTWPAAKRDDSRAQGGRGARQAGIRGEFQKQNSGLAAAGRGRMRHNPEAARARPDCRRLEKEAVRPRSTMPATSPLGQIKRPLQAGGWRSVSRLEAQPARGWALDGAVRGGSQARAAAARYWAASGAGLGGARSDMARAAPARERKEGICRHGQGFPARR